MEEGIDSASSTRIAQIPSDIRVFLFAEVRDYTRFSQEHGDEEAARLVERFATLAREAVDAQGGKVIELRGDEAMAIFASARRALWAAVNLQERYLDETQRNPSLPLKVGVGIDAGEAIPFEGGYRGRALNLAARLKDQARAGQVLATEALIHLAGQVDGLVYIERGFVHPKGYALPVHVIEVLVEGRQPAEVESLYESELRTFLFADIKGYTAFTTERGDAAGVDLQMAYARIVEDSVRARGGRVLDLAGDMAFAVFVSPRQAIHAATELQEQFERAVHREQQGPLTLAIGVEAGEAIPTRGKYAGAAVNLAARVCGFAGPGEVLVGETACRLVRKVEGLLFVDRGTTEITGFTDPVQIMQVVRDEPAAQEAGTSSANTDAR